MEDFLPVVFLLAFIGNLVVGAVVWSSIDYKDRRLFKWYSSCPPRAAWVIQPLVLTCWPVGLAFWIHRKICGLD